MSDTSVDLRGAYEAMPAAAARRTRIEAEALRAFAATADKVVALATLNATLRSQGLPAMSRSTAFRKASLLASGGVLAVADRRRVRRATGVDRVSGNQQLVDFWATLCADNARASAPAWRELIRRLSAGAEIPGVGTWRDLYASEHGGVMPPPDMPCPYGVRNPPTGWSQRNFARIKPSKFGLLAARRGMGAAIMSAAPAVVRTRIGLAPCQVIQIDDMWHECKVSYAGNRHAQRVVELAAQDVLTGKMLSWLIKPVRERDDGTREVLRARWVRYLLAHIFCDIGIPSAGCLIMGERGTATLSDDLVRTLSEVSGGRIRFGAGGINSTPLAAGLPGGQPHGNPRYKGMIEGAHRIVKDILGATQGLIGGGRGAQPEAAYGLDQADERLRRIAAALEPTRPGITQRLVMPYMPYDDFCALVDRAYDQFNGRTDHQIADWESCGFVSGEYRLPGGAWMPTAALSAQSDAVRASINQLIAAGAIEYRQRRLSPAEAFTSRAGDLHRLDRFAARLILGDELAICGTVSDRLQIRCKADADGIDCVVSGVLVDGRTIDRGASVRVWINPLSPAGVAMIEGPDGRYLGEAQIMAAARIDDDAAIAKQLGVRNAAIAAEMRRLAPVVRSRQAAANKAAEINAREILGYDPAALLDAERTASPVAKAQQDSLAASAARFSTDDNDLYL